MRRKEKAPRALVRGSGDDARRARNLGAAGYLRKPVDEHDLAVQVKAARESVHNRKALKSLDINRGEMRMVG